MIIYFLNDTEAISKIVTYSTLRFNSCSSLTSLTKEDGLIKTVKATNIINRQLFKTTFLGATDKIIIMQFKYDFCFIITSPYILKLAYICGSAKL